jgi:2-dehydropantoate 2-reductase
MENQDLSFLVVGAGAIGGITAALLKKAGFNVEIVCKYEEYASLVRSEGIHVSGVCGDINVTMQAYASVSEVKEKKDIILHATKATDMVEAAGALNSILKENGFVVSMQNGICEDALGAVLGRDRVIGCVTGWGATMEAPGKLIMTSTGDFVIGYLDKKPDEFLSSLAVILSSIVPARVTDNIIGHLYSKLIINSCITSLGVICGLYLGEMLKIRKIRKIFIEIMREAVQVADKMQIRIEIFGGRLDFRKFMEGSNFISDLRRHTLIRIIGFKYRRLKSSSLQSIERGRPTEVDYFNGYIVSNGNLHDVPVPVNTEIVKIIHEIEEGRRKISLDNFNNPVFERFND